MTRPGPSRPRDNRPAGRPAQKPTVRKRPTVAPSSWFTDPGLKGPTPLTIDTATGRMFGHVARWDSQHTAMPGVRAPRSRSNYRHFHVGQVDVQDPDGTVRSIDAGVLVHAGHHAPLELTADAAMQHYDLSTAVAGYMRCGEDRWGLWAAGQVEPSLDEVSMRRIRSIGWSGDWRPVDGGPLELIAVTSVPVAGFNSPRYEAGSPGLVAAGAIPSRQQALVASAARKTAEATELRARAGRTREAAELFRELEWSLARTPEAVMRYQAGAVADHAKAITAAARLDLEAHQADVAALADELAALLL